VTIARGAARGQTFHYTPLNLAPWRGFPARRQLFESPTLEAHGPRDVRIAVTLACEDCKRRNYQTNKSKRNNPDRHHAGEVLPLVAAHQPPGNPLASRVVARNRQRNRTPRPDSRPIRTGRPALPGRRGAGPPPIEDAPPVAFADDGDEDLDAASQAFGKPTRGRRRNAAPVGNRIIASCVQAWPSCSGSSGHRQQVAQATGVVLGFVVITGIFLGVATTSPASSSTSSLGTRSCFAGTSSTHIPGRDKVKPTSSTASSRSASNGRCARRRPHRGRLGDEDNQR